MTVTRRSILKVGAGFVLAGATTGAYARYLEPGGALLVRRHVFTPARWTPGLKLRVVCLADLHCGSAHMSLARIRQMIEISHALEPDLICLLGDYVTRERRNVHAVTPRQWSAELARLQAPLGVHAILGNHEFWDDPEVQRRRSGDPFGKLALLDAGVPVFENRALRLVKEGRPFWIAGLADQLAFRIGWSRARGGIFQGLDDLPGTLRQVTDEAPVLLMAHEPDIFAEMDPRVSVTLSGHTHGGQVNLFGFAPWTPSQFGERYRHGRIVENARDLIVSAGLGTSGPPVRFGAPPEIVLLELG
jgi:hypothetical protein